MISDRYTPKTKAERDLWNAKCEADAAHKVWMNTSIFTDAGQKAKQEKDDAFKRYEKAKEAAKA